MKNKTYKLCEALADIAYMAGQKKYYSGNSRADIADFISWAEQFEKINKNVIWGEDGNPDYMEAIEEFTNMKIKENEK